MKGAILIIAPFLGGVAAADVEASTPCACNALGYDDKKACCLKDTDHCTWEEASYPWLPQGHCAVKKTPVAAPQDACSDMCSGTWMAAMQCCARHSDKCHYDKQAAKCVVGPEVHPDRAAMIKEISNTPGVLWKAGAHPRFAADAPGSSKDMMGVKGDQKADIQELVKKGEIVELLLASDAALPDNFDSATNWPQCAKIIDDIRDQSNCGCCWAFAGAEAGSDRMCISTNASVMVPLSAQDICFNGGGIMSRGCSGGQISTPWSMLKKGGLFGGKGAVSGGQYNGSGPFGKGLCSDFSMPHCHHHGPQGKDPYPAENAPGCPSQKSAPGFTKCDADAAAPHNDYASDKYSYTGDTVTVSGEAGIQQAIMAGGPMEVAFTVYADFENYVSGIYHHVSGKEAGGHAVKIVGWGVDSGNKYWKVANSWNPYWGEKGYFRIVRGENEGGIENQAIASSPTAKWSKASDSAAIVV